MQLNRSCGNGCATSGDWESVISALTSQRHNRRTAPAGRERARTTTSVHRSQPAQRPAVTPSFLSDDPDLPPLCTNELNSQQAGEELARLDEQLVKKCQKCGLRADCRQTVFGAGCSRPELAFIGEGPGADEDREGVPFVGRARAITDPHDRCHDLNA